MTTATIPLKILVADDEEGIRNLVSHWLERDGYTLHSVPNASEARRYLESHTVDLVITDVVMPDGDGFELIADLRKRHPQAKIVAMSGDGQYIEGEECLNLARGLGAHATVPKPFNRDQLQAGIDRALASSGRITP